MHLANGQPKGRFAARFASKTDENGLYKSNPIIEERLNAPYS